jgi:hypothetical protein
MSKGLKLSITGANGASIIVIAPAEIRQVFPA